MPDFAAMTTPTAAATRPGADERDVARVGADGALDAVVRDALAALDALDVR